MYGKMQESGSLLGKHSFEFYLSGLEPASCGVFSSWVFSAFTFGVAAVSAGLMVGILFPFRVPAPLGGCNVTTWWLQHSLFYWHTRDICFFDTNSLGLSLGRCTNPGGFPRSRPEKPWAPRGGWVAVGLALRISSAPNLLGPSPHAQRSPRGQHCHDGSPQPWGRLCECWVSLEWFLGSQGLQRAGSLLYSFTHNPSEIWAGPWVCPRWASPCPCGSHCISAGAADVTCLRQLYSIHVTAEGGHLSLETGREPWTLTRICFWDKTGNAVLETFLSKLFQGYPWWSS